jgi:hypothetical protein
VIAAWRAAPDTTPGGQARYSDLAVETALILRTVFHQPLRQTEGLVSSLLELMGLDLPVPDQFDLEPAGQDPGGLLRPGRQAAPRICWSTAPG